MRASPTRGGRRRTSATSAGIASRKAGCHAARPKPRSMSSPRSRRRPAEVVGRVAHHGRLAPGSEVVAAGVDRPAAVERVVRAEVDDAARLRAPRRDPSAGRRSPRRQSTTRAIAASPATTGAYFTDSHGSATTLRRRQRGHARASGPVSAAIAIVTSERGGQLGVHLRAVEGERRGAREGDDGEDGRPRAGRRSAGPRPRAAAAASTPAIAASASLAATQPPRRIGSARSAGSSGSCGLMRVPSGRTAPGPAARPRGSRGSGRSRARRRCRGRSPRRG